MEKIKCHKCGKMVADQQGCSNCGTLFVEGIICPKCKSKNVAYVNDIKKAIWMANPSTMSDAIVFKFQCHDCSKKF